MAGDTSMARDAVAVSIGAERFVARWRRDLAPSSCERMAALLPYSGRAIHARWSGEALWSQLAQVWPQGLMLPPEHARHEPQPGEVLLFAGTASEPELLI